MNDEVMTCFWYWFIPLSILMIFYIYWDMHLSDQCKPKYRLDEDGYVQFYYRRFSYWEYFPLWDDKETDRIVHICDRVRNLDYDISYIGPGRCKLKINYDNYSEKSQKFITNRIRDLYPEFKTSEQLWQLYNLYVNKENTILNKVAKDHIFKAYESN